MDLQNLITTFGLGVNPNDLEIMKSLSAQQGFVGINLEPAAKLMLPLYARLRQRLPVDRPRQGGMNAIWRAQLGYGSFPFQSFGVAEAGIGSTMSESAVTFQVPYKYQSVSGDVTLQSIYHAMGFDDPMAIETARMLSALLRLEELIVLGANNEALPAPANVTASAGPAGSTFAAGNWQVRITALTLPGTIANASSNSNTGESAPSTAVTVAVGASGASYLDVQWDAVPGAVGYKVYVSDAAGSTTHRLVEKSKLADMDGDAIPTAGLYVTVNRVRVTGVPASSQPTPPTSDGTANSLIFEGMIAWASKSSVYGVSIPNRIFIDAKGASLTASPGAIKEIDDALRRLWTDWQISPTLMVTGPMTAKRITDALVTASSPSMYRVEIAPERGGFVGGVFLGGYINKFAANQLPGAASVIPIWAHPYMPESAILLLSERIPYQFAREARAWALDVLIPYTYFRLYPTNEMKLPFAITFAEVLKCYHPSAQAMIVGFQAW